MAIQAAPTTDVRNAGAKAPGRGRKLAMALWGATCLAVLGGGLLLWHSRAELVFLDMVASALAMCF